MPAFKYSDFNITWFVLVVVFDTKASNLIWEPKPSPIGAFIDSEVKTNKSFPTLLSLTCFVIFDVLTPNTLRPVNVPTLVKELLITEDPNVVDDRIFTLLIW